MTAITGSLIVVGPLDLAQYDLFDTAEKLHEACFLATEFGHRIIAVVRTPAPQLLLPDLLRTVESEEYYDLEYVRSAIVGTVEADGQLSRHWATGRRMAGFPGTAGIQESSGLPECSTAESTCAICTTDEPIILQSPSPLDAIAGVTLHPLRKSSLEARSLLRARLDRTLNRERFEGAYVGRDAATNPGGECSPKRGTKRRWHAGPFATNPLSEDDFPDEFAELLNQGITRRHGGILLLGGLPQSAERELMLAEALAATKVVGPGAVILPSYRSHGVDLYTQSLQTADGSFTCSKRFPHLPMFSSVESAYANGCRRIAVEYELEPHRPLPIELLEEYTDDVLFILCVDDVNCGDAFEWATASTWQDLQRLIGALCWSTFRGTRLPVSLYDAFVPEVRAASATQYERPADAVRDGRQLRWERQALRLLDSDQVTWRQLRHHLYASGLIDPDLDYEAAFWSRTKEGLRDWLIAQRVSLRRSISSASPGDGRAH